MVIPIGGKPEVTAFTKGVKTLKRM